MDVLLKLSTVKLNTQAEQSGGKHKLKLSIAQ
jgi:hypothetical protein